MINKLEIENWKLKISAKQGGFTLVEMLVAVGLFVLIVSFSLGALLSIFDANRKAQSSKTVVDNLNLTIENMVRTIHFGSNYYCGVSPDPDDTNDCSGGDDAVSVTFNGDRVVYDLSGTSIRKSYNGGSSYTTITAPEAVIEHLKFYVFESSNFDANQPYIVVVIKGYVGNSNKPSTQIVFSLETLISPRALDI